MANIAISDLNRVEVEFAELSDLELEVVMGGSKSRDVSFEAGYSEKNGANVAGKLTLHF
ncbi:hypothetical protein [Nostoc commune]|uniref:hypothetical protein n=1 Tax=Nostoc commune TaxID=1178 RepID=UPI0018C46473|nr:hypothetical protein [Nostoc commune]